MIISKIQATFILEGMYFVKKSRHCNGPDDWGDEATIKKMLKRKNVDFDDMFFDDGTGIGSFGIYLGNNIVGLTDINRNITSYDYYESRETMQKNWELD